MKILTLNTFCGKRTEHLLSFLHHHRDVDVFCFQEVYHDAEGKDVIWTTDGSNFNLLGDIQSVLQEYHSYYRPHIEDWWGLAMSVKKDFTPVTEIETYVHKYKGYDPINEQRGYSAKNLQIVQTEHNGRLLSIVNFHGLWNNQGKTDTEDRLVQSRNIVAYMKTLSMEFVLCGDFNLLPNTESLQMITRELDCRELVTEFNIKSTRTSLYTKPNKFADYIFVSKGIKVIDFSVLPDVVSDHAPLLLEIE